MEPNIFSLEGKVVLITGAGRGIGKALALGMASAGADVAITELPEEMTNAQETFQAIKQQGKRGLALPLDLRRIQGIPDAVAQAVATLGRLDVLVNNAGWRVPRSALEVIEEEWDHTLDVNLKGLFFCCQAAAREMVPRGGGKIINIASQLGFTGLPERAPYCASKGGVVNLTRALALEWAPYKINVNAIGPGPTRTEMLAQLAQASGSIGSISYLTERVPMGRLLEPDELVGAAVFLASDASNMVTGQTIIVDGGWTAI